VTGSFPRLCHHDSQGAATVAEQLHRDQVVEEITRRVGLLAAQQAAQQAVGLGQFRLPQVALGQLEGAVEIGERWCRHTVRSEITMLTLLQRLFDAFHHSLHNVAMDSLEQAAKDLERLEQQLLALLDQCKKLREENASLQSRQESLVAERAALVSKNEEARTKVEAMINRLKALEH
jgi:cell division protein ZapB